MIGLTYEMKVNHWVEKLNLTGDDEKFLRAFATFMDNAKALEEIESLLMDRDHARKCFEVVSKHIGKVIYTDDENPSIPSEHEDEDD